MSAVPASERNPTPSLENRSYSGIPKDNLGAGGFALAAAEKLGEPAETGHFSSLCYSLFRLHLTEAWRIRLWSADPTRERNLSHSSDPSYAPRNFQSVGYPTSRR